MTALRRRGDDYPIAGNATIAGIAYTAWTLPNGSRAVTRDDGGEVDVDTAELVLFTIEDEAVHACDRCDGTGHVEVIRCTKSPWQECCGGCTALVDCWACKGTGEARSVA